MKRLVGAQSRNKGVRRESPIARGWARLHFIWPAHTHVSLLERKLRFTRYPVQSYGSVGGTKEKPLSYPDTQPCLTLMSGARLHHAHILTCYLARHRLCPWQGYFLNKHGPLGVVAMELKPRAMCFQGRQPQTS